jgi:hypothetical protein
VDRSVTLTEESYTAFLVKRQLDTPTSNRKSLHVRRSQSEQRLTASRNWPGNCLSPIANDRAVLGPGRASSPPARLVRSFGGSYGLAPVGCAHQALHQALMVSR